MWISLAGRTSMWFLGKPKQIKISLNFVDPGPVEVDFNTLELEEQKYILVSLQNGSLKTDEPFQDLLKTYNKKKQKVEAPPEVHEYLKKQKVDKRQEELLKIKAQTEARAQAIVDRCEFLSKQKVKVIKSELKKEKDVKFLRAFLETEEASGKRPSIVILIKDRIRANTKEVALQLHASEQTPPIPIKVPEATFGGDVVESEDTTITLTSEQLKKLAEGHRLGGE